MSNIKTYILLLALGFIVGACGGGSSSSGGSGGGPAPTLSSAQQGLLDEFYKVLATGEEGANENVAPPIIARNVPSSVDGIKEVSGSDGSLPGKYYAIFSDENYDMVDTPEQRNKLRNPPLDDEPGHTDLGKITLTFDTVADGELEIVMLINDTGNSIIALSSLGDFIAGGKPISIENLPTGPLTYSGVNYYKVRTSPDVIENGNFDLTVNLDRSSGKFGSGLTGDITIDESTGNYNGLISIDGTTHENLSIKGQFNGNNGNNGNNESSSVTGLYYGGGEPTVPNIVGAIIGTQTQN